MERATETTENMSENHVHRRHYSSTQRNNSVSQRMCRKSYSNQLVTFSKRLGRKTTKLGGRGRKTWGVGVGGGGLVLGRFEKKSSRSPSIEHGERSKSLGSDDKPWTPRPLGIGTLWCCVQGGYEDSEPHRGEGLVRGTRAEFSSSFATWAGGPICVNKLIEK